MLIRLGQISILLKILLQKNDLYLWSEQQTMKATESN